MTKRATPRPSFGLADDVRRAQANVERLARLGYSLKCIASRWNAESGVYLPVWWIDLAEAVRAIELIAAASTGRREEREEARRSSRKKGTHT